MKITPVILCGGSGTRLWPLSRERHPKQFVDLGEGRTLFKDTLARIKAIPEVGEIIVVCNEAHRFFVSEEMREMGINGKVILEPAPRNTAPAIALAAELLVDAPETAMLVMPSDHYLEDSDVLAETVERAAALAEQGKIIAFGVTPDSPHTGYGYIRAGTPLPAGFEIAEFVEKPDQDTARNMLREGGYYWNAGLFLMAPKTYLEELKKYSPEIAKSARAAMANASQENGYIRPDEEIFLASPEDSIDYAVMEKTENAAMMPLNAVWSDLGSWEAFFQQAEKDANHNAIHGDVLATDTHDCYLHSTGRLLATTGIANLMVVETGDAVVVAGRSEGQRIKDIVKNLKKKGDYHYRQHPLVYKPWGSDEILSSGERFQVKRLIVNPGERQSLQYHHHRAEHWVIVSGTAAIELDGEKKLYTENQSIYIPIGCRHMLANPGKIPLILIEVQTGSFLEENDIVRLDDKYGRAISGKYNERLD